MTGTRFLIGIDLGTTHTVVAYADISKGIENACPKLFEIQQLVAPGEVAAKPLLPSFRYHPAPGELAERDLLLPWKPAGPTGEIRQVVIGEWARALGSKVEGRLVSSAKSWLSHPQVDRGEPILPWAAAAEVERVSPVLASASYLEHVRQAWNYAEPHYPMEKQEVVVTVPASFDEAARALTVEAAAMAGLESVLLLEEPQAVVYDWYASHEKQASRLLEDCELLLVCDVGGGTTDLSLITVGFAGNDLQLKRVGVGDHLMLGGDNIDLALAHLAERRISGEAKLSAASLSQLIQQTRIAKERLLAAEPPDNARVTLLGSGARLIGGARSCELQQAEVSELALDGFLPICGIDELPIGRRSAMVEFGLPYAADPAISRHIAAFLTRHNEVCRKALGLSDDSGSALPNAVIFNGGVFHSAAFKQRALTILGQWAGGSVTELENDSPDLAVARGAVAYLMARHGGQIKIGGGAARSFFLRIEASEDTSQAICLLPKGTEEGVEVLLNAHRFSLRLGQPVQFDLLSSSSGGDHTLGEILPIDDESLSPLPPLVGALTSHAQQVEVVLAARLSEVGTLQLECVDVNDGGRRWRLEFQIRPDLSAPQQGDILPVAGLPKQFEAAKDMIGRVFGRRSKGVKPDAVKQLRRDLEKILGKQDEWESPVLRALSDQLIGFQKHRRRSANHERVWLNLTGLGLRPGFGFPLDEWRLQQLWPLFGQGLQYQKEPQAWSSWWIFWRRIAGGLDAQQQLQIFRRIEGQILSHPGPGKKAQKGGREKSFDDLLRLAASLEHLPIEVKISIGDWLVAGLKKSAGTPSSWWALGRLAAREPFHGSAHRVIPREKLSDWLPLLMKHDWKKDHNAAFAAVMMARMTGDRERDLDENVRQSIVDKLKRARSPERWHDMVAKTSQLDESETRRFFGERLPVGLKLIE